MYVHQKSSNSNTIVEIVAGLQWARVAYVPQKQYQRLKQKPRLKQKLPPKKQQQRRKNN
jgi:hypothetical protein